MRGLAEPDADLPALGAYGYRYIVPTTPGPAVFRARSAEAVPAAGGLWDDVEVTKRLCPPLTPALLRPLMPLSRGHLAQFGVSGLLRNTVLQARDGTPYLVKGRAIKARTVRAHEEENEKGHSVSVRITRESAETGVTLLNLQTGCGSTRDQPTRSGRSRGSWRSSGPASRAPSSTLARPSTRPRSIRSIVRWSSASRGSRWGGRPTP